MVHPMPERGCIRVRHRPLMRHAYGSRTATPLHLRHRYCRREKFFSRFCVLGIERATYHGCAFASANLVRRGSDNSGMKCQVCPRKLPTGARAGTLYCGTRCRSRAFRARREAAQPAVLPSVESADTPAQEPTAYPDPASTRSSANARTANRRSRQRAHAETPELRPELPSTATQRPPRIPLERQVCSQAPAGAAGYRLVLPTRSHAETPKIAPAPDASGGIAYWTLSPFQLPDDIRLQDGHTYRLLWVDSQGQPLPPHGAAHLPALHVFLGPPDEESADTTLPDEVFGSILQGVTNPEVRAQAEAELVKLRVTEARTRQRERSLQQQIAAADAQLRIVRETSERRQKERDAQEQAAKAQREEAERRSAR